MNLLDQNCKAQISLATENFGTKQQINSILPGRRSGKINSQFEAQALFLAVSGTQKEKINLLELMTGAKFQACREVGVRFQNRNSCGRTVNAIIIKYIPILLQVSECFPDGLSHGRSGKSHS